MSQRTRAAKSTQSGQTSAAQTRAEAEIAGEGATPTPAKPPRPSRARRSPAPPVPVMAEMAVGAGPVSGEEIARVLRAVAGELERDPALARRVASAMEGAAPFPAPSPERGAPAVPVARPASAAPAQPVAEDEEIREAEAPPDPVGVGRSFYPRLVTGLAPNLGPGVPNPFELRARLGEAGLRDALGELRLGTLRAMVREHQLDPKGKLKGVNDAEKLRAMILAATAPGDG